MSIPKRVRSDKRIVWHDSNFQVYLRDNKLQYQDKKWLRHELGESLLTYEQLMELENDAARLQELNRYPAAYYEELQPEMDERTWMLTWTNLTYQELTNQREEILM